MEALKNISKYLSMVSRSDNPLRFADIIEDCAVGLINIAKEVEGPVGEALDSIGEGLLELIEGKTLIDIKTRLDQDSHRVEDLRRLLEM